jgi:hypothetical protein
MGAMMEIGHEEDEAPTIKGKWLLSNITMIDLERLVAKDFLPPQEACSWHSAVGDEVPAPQEGEIVVLKSHIEMGISFLPSDFFSEVFSHYGLQPFHLSPNSIVTLSGFISLCEGYLGIRPRLDLFSF